MWATVAALLVVALFPRSRAQTDYGGDYDFAAAGGPFITPANDYSYVSSSSELRAALSSTNVWIVVLTGTVVLHPADWATPVRLTHHVQVQGYDGGSTYRAEYPVPPLVTLDCSGLKSIIQIGDGAALQLWRLELLNHMQHDGTPEAYSCGMPIIDAAASGVGATLIWWNVVSYVPVGLPLSVIGNYAWRRVYAQMEADGYFNDGADEDYRINTAVNRVIYSEDANAMCYKTSRRYEEICRPVVRLGRGRGRRWWWRCMLASWARQAKRGAMHACVQRLQMQQDAFAHLHS